MHERTSERVYLLGWKDDSLNLWNIWKCLAQWAGTDNKWHVPRHGIFCSDFIEVSLPATQLNFFCTLILSVKKYMHLKTSPMIAWHDGSLYLVYHLTERRAREEWFLLREVKKLKGGLWGSKSGVVRRKRAKAAGHTGYRQSTLNVRPFFFKLLSWITIWGFVALAHPFPIPLPSGSIFLCYKFAICTSRPILYKLLTQINLLANFANGVFRSFSLVNFQ